MTPPLSKTLVAGLLGGLAFWVVTFLTFVLLGSGLDEASGPLVDPALQSSKLLAVWTELEPLPLFATAPQLILAAYIGFGIGQAFIFVPYRTRGRPAAGRGPGAWLYWSGRCRTCFSRCSAR